MEQDRPPKPTRRQVRLPCPDLRILAADTTFPAGVGVRAGCSPFPVPAAPSDLESISDQTVGLFAGDASRNLHGSIQGAWETLSNGGRAGRPPRRYPPGLLETISALLTGKESSARTRSISACNRTWWKSHASCAGTWIRKGTLSLTAGHKPVPRVSASQMPSTPSARASGQALELRPHNALTCHHRMIRPRSSSTSLISSPSGNRVGERDDCR